MFDRVVQGLLGEALMASVFISPSDPGLTYDELVEVGRRAGHGDGMINDALQFLQTGYDGDRHLPSEEAFRHAASFMPEEPEFLDYKALDFVIRALNERIAAVGAREARIDRSVVVESAVRSGCDRTAVQAAIAFMVRAERLVEDGTSLRTTQIAGTMGLPGDLNRQLRGGLAQRAMLHPQRAEARAIVRDLVARRGDGRPAQADPLDAFPDTLTALGFDRFRMWWTQTVAELRACDPNTMPTAAVVLAAALVEGALSFVVRYARDRNVGPLLSRDFERPPQSWQLRDLVQSAAQGGDAAVLKPALKARADLLVEARHRIHAGRLIADYPTHLPDLRPEETRASKETAELVARAVMDWLQRFPAGDAAA